MRLLRGALAANAAFSGVSGVAFALAGHRVANVLGDVPAWSVRAIGLLAFAALVAWQARRPTRRPVTAVIAADALWVAASAALIVIAPSWLARDGIVLVAGVALVVGALGAAQGVGLRRARA